MKLQKLHIRRMPGVSDFELSDLATGVTVVTGPNGSGKTTACRAIRGLLWPEELRNVVFPELESTWLLDDGRTATLSVSGADRRCYIEGSVQESLSLPPSHLASCYTITIDDLFADNDAELAREVERELSGGFDLAAVMQAEALQVKRTRIRDAVRHIQQLSLRVRELQSAQRALHLKREKLAEMETRASEARRAQTRLARIDDALRHNTVLRDLEALRSRHTQFQPAVARICGGERRELERLQSESIERRQEAASAAEALEQAAERLATTGTTFADLALRDQLHCRDQIETLRALQADIEQREAHIEGLLTTCRSLQRKLGGLGNPASLALLEPQELEEIEQFQRLVESHEAKVLQLRTQLQIAETELGSGPLPASEELREQIRLLEQWLALDSTHRIATVRTLVAAGSVAAVVAIVTTLFLATDGFRANNSDPLWFTATAISLGTLLFLLFAARGDARRKRALEEEFLSRYQPQAVPFEAPYVRSTISSLLETYEQSRRVEHAEQTAKDVRTLLKGMETEEARIQRTQGLLAERLGCAPSASTLTLVAFASSLRDFQQSYQALEASNAELEHRIEERNRILGAVNRFFGQFSVPEVASGAAASASYAELEVRAAQGRTATQEHKLAQAAVERAQAALERIDAARKAFFERFDLPDDADAAFETLMSDFEAFEQSKLKIQELERERVSIVDRLERDAPDLLQLSEDELIVEQLEAHQLGEQADALWSTVVETRLLIGQAEQETVLEEALRDLEESRAALAEYHEQTLLAGAADVLLATVVNEHESTRLPAVLLRANELFERFTHQRYGLLRAEQGEREPTFRARDLATGAVVSLESLSRGTRSQLLLAARVAFAEHQERRERLPFVLDEVLSSTDPQRFQRVAEALFALAADGRQLLYFSCQPYDAEQWALAASANPAVAVRFLELTHSGRASTAPAPLAAQAIARLESAVEAPNGRSISAYIEALRLPPLKVLQGAEAAHLGHLVTDPELLYRLLSTGLHRFGQLRRLIAANASAGYIGEADRAQVEARAKLIDRLCADARIGRAKVLSTEALLSFVSTSKRLEQELVQLTTTLGGDATLLLQLIDPARPGGSLIPGFRKNTFEKLRERLIEEGYVAFEARLPREETWLRFLAHAEPAVTSGILDPGEVSAFFALLWDTIPQAPSEVVPPASAQELSNVAQAGR
ncbi:MAG: AAA family ATPase [Bdellovibrionales bacterium]|nr:AAA family ATPase [Bdellovibrionales bacterium]